MSEEMNVLFIISDAHRADHLSCYGNPILKTPNLDKFAKEGVRFSNYFCTAPICMPNRATLHTGLYPNVHGVRSNGINLREDLPNIAQTLMKRGWRTAVMGKTHFQFMSPPYRRKTKSAECWGDWLAEEAGNNPVKGNFPLPYYGFQEVDFATGNGTICVGHYLDWLEKKSPKHAEFVKKKWRRIDNYFSLWCDKGFPEELYSTTYIKERTIAFLERHARGDYGDNPFYLHCSFLDPHYPLCPPGKYYDMYKPEEIELPPNFKDAKNLYSHKFLGPLLKNPPFFRAFLRETNEEETRKFIALTYGSVALIDYSIGEILSTLKKLGYADNTIVMYSSDHGDLMGDHGLLFKGPCPYNGVLHLPLIWKVPGLTKPGVCESLITSIDIPKTILNLLHIKERHQPPDMQGFNMTPILLDPNKKVRDCVFIENDEEVGSLEARLRHLVTEDYKLTIYEGFEDHGDLFDRKNDPDELNNLWYNEKFNNIRFKLVNKLLQENLKAQTHYPKRVAGT